MKRSIAFSLITVIVVLMNLAITPTMASRQEPVSNDPSGYVDFSLPEAHEAGKFTLYEQNGAVACREATAEEAEIFQRDPGIALHPISHPNAYAVMGKDRGLKIILRATEQLEKFPEAKADLQKFVAMPGADAAQVEEAKKILEQLK